MQNNDNLYLIDRQHDEVFDMTDSKHRINRDFILDFDEGEEKTKEKAFSMDLFIATGGASESETDRKKKRQWKR